MSTLFQPGAKIGEPPSPAPAAPTPKPSGQDMMKLFQPGAAVGTSPTAAAQPASAQGPKPSSQDLMKMFQQGGKIGPTKSEAAASTWTRSLGGRPARNDDGLTSDQKEHVQELNYLCVTCHFAGADQHILTDGKLKPLEEMLKEDPPVIIEGAMPGATVRTRPDDWAKRLKLDQTGYLHSAHKDSLCIDCHVQLREMENLPHHQYLPKPQCNYCHEDEQNLWNTGTHGQAIAKADAQAPECGRCHFDYHTMDLERPATAALYPTRIVQTCSGCHADPEVLDSPNHKDLRKDTVATFVGSVHWDGLFRAGLMQAANCASCHGPHRNLPADDLDSSVSLKNVASTCGTCHTAPASTFTLSIHGTKLALLDLGTSHTKADTPPNCASCHGDHKILQPKEPAAKLAMIDTCGECHQERLNTYHLTYHGKAAAFQGLDTAQCFNCHDYHDIHEKTSPLSTISSGRIVETCKQCHEQADARFATFMPHNDPTDPSEPRTFYPWLFMTLLLVGTLAFFFAHSVIWFFSEWREFRHKRAAGLLRPTGSLYRYQRFNLVHRLTHAILFISVIGLCITGLPLRFVEHDWAKWMMFRLGGVTIAGVLHRIFGALTLLYVGLHFGYLFYLWRRAPKRPVLQWVFGPNSMIPSWTDVRQFIEHMKYFFGKGPMPRFGRWTYFEKFDYWAVFWGVAIIGASGLVMAFSNTLSRILPGWAFNVALLVHSDEALLAASFLFAIHFFHVHMRPLKFPWDQAMFTGVVTKEEMEEERSGELVALREAKQLDAIRVPAPDAGTVVAQRVFAFSMLAIGLVLLALLFYSEILYRLIRIL